MDQSPESDEVDVNWRESYDRRDRHNDRRPRYFGGEQGYSPNRYQGFRGAQAVVWGVVLFILQFSK